MALRLYLLPVVHLTTPRHEVPKYLPHRFSPPLPGLEGVVWSWATYLLQDVGLAVADTTTAQHNLLNAQTDVLAVPLNLSNTFNTTVRDRIRTLFDGWKIPSSWVVTGMTYRVVLRTMLNIWQFHNRYVGHTGTVLFGAGITLDTTWSQLATEVQDGLTTAAASMNLDSSGLIATTTVRQILKSIADQLGDIPYTIGPMTI